METALPEKRYYKIGEVARFTSLRTSVLRFWESEFRELTPFKSRSGQRLYTRQDIELLLEIKQLLYHEKLTIEGARKRLASRMKHLHGDLTVAAEGCEDGSLLQVLRGVRDELQALRDSL